MPRDYPDNVRKQNFLSEMYGKERAAQLNNYFKRASAMKEGDEGEVEGSRQFQVFRRRIEAACPRPSAALVKLKEKTKDEDNNVDNKSTATVPSTSHVVSLPPLIRSADVPDMYESAPPTRQRIYSEGREVYLRERHRRRPESRYVFPVISSWEYGWRLGDVTSIDEIRNPTHGRCRIVADTFYRSNGLPQLG